MKNKIIFLCSLVFAIFVLISCNEENTGNAYSNSDSLTTAYNSLKGEFDSKMQQINSLQDSINKMAAKFLNSNAVSDADKARFDQLKQEVRNLKNENITLVNKINTISKDINKQTPETSNDNQKMDELKKQIADLKAKQNELVEKNNQLIAENEKKEAELKKLEPIVISANTFEIIDVKVRFFNSNVITNNKNGIQIIEFCYVVKDNPNAEAGDKTVNIAIFDPAGQLLSNDQTNVFNLHNGQSSGFSTKDNLTINHDKSIYEKCTEWKRQDLVLADGNYTAKFYVNGYMSGVKVFTVK